MCLLHAVLRSRFLGLREHRAVLCGNQSSSALQFVVSRGLREVLLAPVGRVYQRNVVSEFGPKTWPRCRDSETRVHARLADLQGHLVELVEERRAAGVHGVHRVSVFVELSLLSSVFEPLHDAIHLVVRDWALLFGRFGGCR